MGNTNSTDGNNLVASIQRRRSRSNSSASIPQKNIAQPSPRQSFQLSITEPVEATTNHWEPTEPPITEDSPTKPIQMKRDDPTPPVTNTAHSKGWVSSTGAASPWFGYLSSSASSHHRASISGPYYRTRGMSVTRDNENDEDLSNIIASSSLSSPPKADEPVITIDEPVTADTTTTDTPTNDSPTDDALKINTSSKDKSTDDTPTDDAIAVQPVPSISNTSTSTTATNTTTNTATAQPSAPPSTTSHGVPTIITWTQGGNNVYVTGTFNGWKHKIKLVKSTHDFNAVLELPPGTHRLKFIVDDEWKCSNDMETATDPDGNLVNYLQVLDEDEENEHEEFDVTEYSNVIPADLLQLAAVSESSEETDRRVLEWEKKQPQPPTLPPHLEKVLLNSNTVSEEDNSVLQEPNHVTLNHLYACSIKDNVMALATTSRYRKKYVTTMYYRPVFPKS
ncbi:uncharacterized protein EV154DRAFT_557695 [Mucor mucedo]|uniref:uncharacterized protein n=1 Tax=Mucor mucedo TaxID=29922 RepID=UPI00221ED439|nr:uncharacterized protein EV154DRAFT_557695 [Mucor mucedo]KAI7897390.1 hypothetical protein EV154DRAFT_557695 [Mucor mucedo]